jgi:flagellin-like protein
MKNKLIHKNDALSPVIAAIILIAVTVAVAIAATAWLGSMSFSFMATEELHITDCQLATDFSYADLTITNTGTKSATIPKSYLWALIINFS